MGVPLVVEEHAGLSREREPVSVGIPLERGRVRSSSTLRLVDGRGEALPLQTEPLARWSDGSLKWVLVDTLITVPEKGRAELALEVVDGPVEPGEGALATKQSMAEVVVDAGPLRATFPRSGEALLSKLEVGGVSLLDDGGLRLRLKDQSCAAHELVLSSVDVSTSGPVRTTVTLRGHLGPHLLAECRLSAYAGRGLLRCDVTLRNPRPAEHPGGLWDLGDPGSILFKDLSLLGRLATPPEAASSAFTDQLGAELEEAPSGPVEIYQDSSGGERWNARTHVNREDRVPCSFRGYRVTTAEGTRMGERAAPTLWVRGPAGGLGAAVREFWQCYPKALESRESELRVRLWPGQFDDLHELQGGEQKTHTIWLSTEAPAAPLDWTAEPLLASSTPAHYVASGALPHLIAWDEDDDERMLSLASLVVDEREGLAARREQIDEYGWRNYGDVYADHEAVKHEGPEPLISHYNNQYDGLYGALAQFARSGDRRFFDLADAMARHVADVDVYHTSQDRAAYNHGPFWHTDHYPDAYTSSHRCYSRRSPHGDQGWYGGGPSNEHDYVAGLATHYLMTGWAPSRAAVLEIAEWVIDQDDPKLTLIGKVLPGPTGLPTRTVDTHYQGPGRGAGNSIHTLVDTFELTGNERYLRVAEEFIRRVIHPDDDREAIGLTVDPENRWAYTVLLQAMFHYLEAKAEAGQLDQGYAYARETLVSYVRWMLDHEQLSSEMRDRLLIWTETWPAQDIRKGLVLMRATHLMESASERASLYEKGRGIYDGALDQLLEWETRKRARPLFLMMRYGFEGSRLRSEGPGDEARLPRGPELEARGKPTWFVPWRAMPAYFKEQLQKRLAALRG